MKTRTGGTDRLVVDWNDWLVVAWIDAFHITLFINIGIFNHLRTDNQVVNEISVFPCNKKLGSEKYLEVDMFWITSGKSIYFCTWIRKVIIV